jgi:cell cycle arrest protein BUB3
VHVYDIRKMSEPQQRRESSLKHQTRCIRTFPDGTGYALSSVEGRVAIEYFDPSDEVQKQKYEMLSVPQVQLTPVALSGMSSSAIAQL